MILLALFAVDAAAERQAPDPYRVAQQIDDQGSKDSKEKTAGDSAADAAYLNRVWLDLVGERDGGKGEGGVLPPGGDAVGDGPDTNGEGEEAKG